MSKPSTDTATERHVARYREDGTFPSLLTLRFLALLTKKELAALARHYEKSGNRGARYQRVQSERSQRGHIK